VPTRAFGTNLVLEALVGTKFWHCCLVPQDLVSTSDGSTRMLSASGMKTGHNILWKLSYGSNSWIKGALHGFVRVKFRSSIQHKLPNLLDDLTKCGCLIFFLVPEFGSKFNGTLPAPRRGIFTNLFLNCSLVSPRPKVLGFECGLFCKLE
jgi:hypothetical protein